MPTRKSGTRMTCCGTAQDARLETVAAPRVACHGSSETYLHPQLTELRSVCAPIRVPEMRMWGLQSWKSMCEQACSNTEELT